VLGQRRQRVVIGRAGVDHERLTEPAGEDDLGEERTLLVGLSGALAVVVESGLADGDAARVGGERLEFGELAIVEGSRVVRVVADDGVDLREQLGRCQGEPRGGGVGPDGGDPRDALAPGRFDQLLGRRRAGVQVSVAVDHVVRARFGNSGSSGLMT
jgi:hypothetical protein